MNNDSTQSGVTNSQRNFKLRTRFSLLVYLVIGLIFYVFVQQEVHILPLYLRLQLGVHRAVGVFRVLFEVVLVFFSCWPELVEFLQLGDDPVFVF